MLPDINIQSKIRKDKLLLPAFLSLTMLIGSIFIKEQISSNVDVAFTEEKDISTKSPLIEPIFNNVLPELLALSAEDNPAEDNPGQCKISNTFSADVKNWEKDICRWSQEHDMDPDLIATIMQIESCGNEKAVSATGVRGLFQVTGANLDGENPFDPNVSMAKGPGKVLKNELAASGGNVKAALAGYNGGAKAREYAAGNISRNQFYQFLLRHPSRLWNTQRKALAKINEVEWYARWADIYTESKEEKKDTLQVWWELGGHRLCSSSS